MLLRIRHTTSYHYPFPAAESHNEVRLKPFTDSAQTCLDFRITVRPNARIFEYQTPFGSVHHFNVRSPHTEMEISAEALVETRSSDPFAGLNLSEDDWHNYREDAGRRLFPEYLAPTRLVPIEPAAASIAASARSRDGKTVAAFLITLNLILHGLLTYDTAATTVSSTLSEFLADRRGVCQDFTHLMLAVCRSQGIPSRYVSGYLLAGPKQPEVVGAEAMHAWVECYLPTGRWHGFDPTNDLLVNDHYVKVHVGRDYHDVSPSRGVYRGPAGEKLEVRVSVTAE